MTEKPDDDGPQIPVPEEFAAPIRAAMAESQQRQRDDKPVADRKALAKALFDVRYGKLVTDNSDFVAKVYEECEAEVRALLASGVIRDAAEEREDERIALALKTHQPILDPHGVGCIPVEDAARIARNGGAS
jgi:hypothetical protein